MSLSDRRLIASVLAAWLFTVGCFVGFLLAPTPRGKSIALGFFVLMFAIAGVYFVARMLAGGQIGTGLRGMPADEFIRRDEDPLRFWNIAAAVIVFSLGLLIFSAGLLFGWVTLPFK